MLGLDTDTSSGFGAEQLMHNSLEDDGLGQLVVWPQHPWKTSGLSQHCRQRVLLIAPAAVGGVGDLGVRGESRGQKESRKTGEKTGTLLREL